MTVHPEDVEAPQEEPEQAYHPNMREGGVVKGGACFLNQSRICGADCMAYLTNPPDGKAYVGANWAQCHLLVNMDRTGRHLALIHQEINTINTNMKKRQADATRPMPPSPKGG